MDGVILRGDRLVVPRDFRQLVVDTAHEGHQGAVKCKQLLITRVWFPGLDKMVEDKVSGCLGCQSTTYTPTRDPLKPTPLPEREWQKVAMDFWGPTPGGEYILLIIDEYSRYPEIEFVTSTSANASVPKIDKVFSTHGFPMEIKTDGGPPFNGHDFEQYTKWAGIRHRIVSPQDPEANGLAENFMKAIGKVYHIAKIEGKPYKQEMYKFLRHYRSTPHSLTGKAPVELLFHRTVNLRIPTLIPARTNTDQQTRLNDQNAKLRQKKHKDNKRNVRPHNIGVGDKVLLLQKKTKSTPQYDPWPYKVEKVMGSQIRATRSDGKVRVRDAQKFKKYETSPVSSYGLQRDMVDRFMEEVEFDVDPPNGQRNHDQNDVPGRNEPGNRPRPHQGPDVGHNQPEIRPGPPQNNEHERDEMNEPPIPPRNNRTGRVYHYPNGHLDPNVDIYLPRGARARHPPQRYDL